MPFEGLVFGGRKVVVCRRLGVYITLAVSDISWGLENTCRMTLLWFRPPEWLFPLIFGVAVIRRIGDCWEWSFAAAVDG